MKKEPKLLVRDLRGLMEEDRRLNGRNLYDIYPFDHVIRHLGSIPVESLKTADIERYKGTRLTETFTAAHRTYHGAKPGTVNQELRFLNRGLRLARRLELVSRTPHVSFLRVENARRGFLEPETFARIARTLEVLDPPVADVIRWLYSTGSRREEALGLTWHEVDLQAGVVTLAPERVKSRTVRRLRLSEDLTRLLRRRWDLRSGPYVFHRAGARIREFRGAWRRACAAAGKPDLLVHDLRRSFARNALLAGIPQRVVMELAGWRTTSMWSRYAIVDEAAQADALERLSAYTKGKPRTRSKRLAADPEPRRTAPALTPASRPEEPKGRSDREDLQQWLLGSNGREPPCR